MREDERSSPSPLSVSHELDGICDTFEAELQAGGSPQIEGYLGNVGVENQTELLRLLLQIEIELLRRRKTLPTLESYQQRFPHHVELIGRVYADRHGRSTSVANQTRVAARPSQAVSGTGTILNGMSSSDTSQTGVHAAPLVPATGVIPTKFGRFEIIKVLGQGAFGTVYQARDPQLDRSVALKVPRAEMLRHDGGRQRFLREARSAGNLRHRNICPVHDVLENDGLPYIVMAFIDGKPLSAFIGPQKPRSGRDAAAIARKLALALETAHQMGVVHRDLKPDNIMIDRKTKEPVIMDFGLARRDDEANVSHSGQIMGTPTYMPPEQARGDTHAIGPCSDIYSLGVILYEMLCGQRPFTGSIAEVFSGILTTEPVPPSQHHAGVDPTLEQICLKAMSKKIEDRYSSMRELADALMAYLKQPSGSLITNVDPLKATQTYVRRLRKPFWEKLFPSPKKEHAVDKSLAKKSKGIWKGRSLWGRTLISVGTVAVLIFFSVILFRTKYGTVQIEILDPSLNVTFAGETITVDNDGKPIEVTPGPNSLFVSYEGLKVPVEKSFEVKRGKSIALRVTRVGKEVVLLKPDDAVPVNPVSTAPQFEFVRAITGDPQLVWGVSFLNDGRQLATAITNRGVLKCWDVSSGEFVREFDGENHGVTAYAFSSDEKRIALGTWMGRVQVFDTESKKELFSTKMPYSPKGVRFSEDGSRLYIAGGGSDNGPRSMGGTQSGMDPTRYQQMIDQAKSRGAPDRSIKMMEERLKEMRGTQGAAPTGQRYLEIWSLDDGKQITGDDLDTGPLLDMQFSPDGSQFATCGKQGEFVLRDIKTGRSLDQISIGENHPTIIKKLAYSTDSRFLAACFSEGFAVYDCHMKQIVYRESTTTPVNVIIFAPKTHILVTGHDNNGQVQLWDVDVQTQIGTVPEDKFSIGCLAFTRDGSRLAIRNTSSGDVSIWQMNFPGSELSHSPASTD